MKENLLLMAYDLREVWNGWHQWKVEGLALDRQRNNKGLLPLMKEGRQDLNKDKFAGVGWEGQGVHT